MRLITFGLLGEAFKASFNFCFFLLLRTLDWSSISKAWFLSAACSSGDFHFSHVNIDIDPRNRRESLFVFERQRIMAIQIEKTTLSRQKNETILLAYDSLAG